MRACDAASSLTPFPSPIGRGAVVRGKAVKAQSKIEIERMTVPARFRKTEQRVSSAWPTLPKFGKR